MVGDDVFQEMIDRAFAALPAEHRQNVQNVALLYADEPTPEQRERLLLRHDQTLLGLYEGVPLSKRQGTTRILPDKITLFKLPLWHKSGGDLRVLQEEIYHTLWHEIAHYYGLDHDQIHARESAV